MIRFQALGIPGSQLSGYRPVPGAPTAGQLIRAMQDKLPSGLKAFARETGGSNSAVIVHTTAGSPEEAAVKGFIKDQGVNVVYQGSLDEVSRKLTAHWEPGKLDLYQADGATPWEGIAIPNRVLVAHTIGHGVSNGKPKDKSTLPEKLRQLAAFETWREPFDALVIRFRNPKQADLVRRFLKHHKILPFFQAPLPQLRWQLLEHQEQQDTPYHKKRRQPVAAKNGTNGHHQHQNGMLPHGGHKEPVGT